MDVQQWFGIRINETEIILQNKLCCVYKRLIFMVSALASCPKGDCLVGWAWACYLDGFVGDGITRCNYTYPVIYVIEVKFKLNFSPILPLVDCVEDRNSFLLLAWRGWREPDAKILVY